MIKKEKGGIPDILSSNIKGIIFSLILLINGKYLKFMIILKWLINQNKENEIKV